ncbi:MAG: hypothetical protein P8M08_13485, partial [Akkermansiaceae bacterium]|nr:hypothetical protein [Akkermansiaceae bacterium]
LKTTSGQQLLECPFEIEVFQGRLDLTEVIATFHPARGGHRPRGFGLQSSSGQQETEARWDETP